MFSSLQTGTLIQFTNIQTKQRETEKIKEINITGSAAAATKQITAAKSMKITKKRC